MKHYYAEYNRYGIGSITTSANGLSQSAGTLMRFTSSVDRDEWVDSDVVENGHYTRASTTRRHAQQYHNGAFSENAVWCSDDDDVNEKFIGNM